MGNRPNIEITRRDTLKGAAAVAAIGTAAALSTGCARTYEFIMGPTPVAPAGPDGKTAFRLINRFGFGARPGELTAIEEQGADEWFKNQLNAGDDPLYLQLSVGRLDIYNLPMMDLRNMYPRSVTAMQQEACIMRAVGSPWQLRERMVNVWFDHLNVFSGKGLASYRLPNYENEVIRKHALGMFPEMIEASAHHSAMLNYLDQQSSNQEHPNENYARELLELHTMGVDGGYTQRDVMEVARCFTGWGEERGFLRNKGGFKFDDEYEVEGKNYVIHDKGEKYVLGHRIAAGGGKEDGMKVLEIVSAHPSTARYISKKLLRAFVAEPTSVLQNKLEKTFLSTKGDIKAMLQVIYDSKEWQGAPVVKRPFDFVISALRVLDGQTTGSGAVREGMASMGHAPYEWPMPDGYPMEPEAWQGSLLGRWRFAHTLAHGISGTSVNAEQQVARWKGEDHEKVVQAVFHQDAKLGNLEALSQSLKNSSIDDTRLLVSLALSSPEFQWR